jgi:CubicO group peptidase (beta-lactamase class C family)
VKKIVVLVVGGLCALVLQACGGGAAGGGADKGPPVIVAPPPSDQQWTLADPAAVGMDGAMLKLAVDSLPDAVDHRLASMLVLRHGKPVLEQYWNGYNKDSLHDLRSATKSITSLMVGIAIDKGMIEGVNEPISKHLAASYPAAPALQHNITLAHLLTMRSGLACNDWNTTSPGNEEKMYQTEDWVHFFLNLPAATTPGAQTNYCTGGVVALGRVIAEASKRTIPNFAEQFLFAPLGVAGARWASFDKQRQTDSGGHLYLRPRDMAKIGQLVLQQGKWNGDQLISADWIAQSTRQHTGYLTGGQYGYLWWIMQVDFKGRIVNVHFADGNGGQYIFVVPELDLVAVFTGENYNSNKAELPKQLMSKLIIQSVLD